MKDTIFVMFNKDAWKLFDRKSSYRLFQNGFSYTWDYCKNHGDIVWLTYGDDLPITKGTVYVSGWFKEDGIEAARWAKENPKLNIIMGGPLFAHYNINVGKDLPNFSYIRFDDAEKYFNIKDKLKWNLEVLPGYENVGYSFGITIGTGCYWGECCYCKMHKGPVYREFEEIPIIDYPGNKFIWLHTFSIEPDMIRSLIPKLENRNDVNYITYMRADKNIYKALKYAFKNKKVDGSHLYFDLGIEVPSDRMLNWMKKGSTVKNYLNVIDLLYKQNCRMHFNLMTEWPNITEEDVDSIGRFLLELEKIGCAKNVTANLYPIQIVYDRQFFHEFKDVYKEHNPFWDMDIYHPNLTEEQININNKVRKLYANFPFLHFEDFSGRPLF
jgi:hypothetical protein